MTIPLKDSMEAPFSSNPCEIKLQTKKGVFILATREPITGVYIKNVKDRGDVAFSCHPHYRIG